jgi:hypothetical protein
MLDASCAELPLLVALLKAITPVSGGGPPTVGPERFAYCYTPLGLRKGASPHRRRHGTVREGSTNPRQISAAAENVMPCPGGEAGQGCLRHMFTEGGPPPTNHDPSRGYTPLEKPWNGEEAGENCPALETRKSKYG